MAENIPTSRSNDGENEPVVFHYTSFFGLTGITTSKSLWCSKIQYLNDSRELLDGLDRLAHACQKHSKYRDLRSGVLAASRQLSGINLFVCSFSEAGDTLSQWRGYADGGGVSISFSFKRLQNQAKKYGFTLEKCVYAAADKDKILSEFLSHYSTSKAKPEVSSEMRGFNLALDFLPIAARFKNESFSEEREWRLISPIVSAEERSIEVRATSTGLIPYIEFDLRTGDQPLLSDAQYRRTNEDVCVRSVVVGPNRERELQIEAVGKLFDSHDVTCGVVEHSSIPFRFL